MGAGIDCEPSIWAGIDCVPSMVAGIDCVPLVGLGQTVYHQWMLG